MRDLILLGLAGVLLGLLGGTTLVVVREGEAHVERIARGEPAAAQSAATDSLVAADGTAGLVDVPIDSATLALAEPVVDAEPTDAGTRGMPDSTIVAVPADSVAARPVVTGPMPGPEDLAGYLKAMQPRAAAQVLQQMSDEEVAALLAMIGGRKASAIMGSLPPERAAAVGRIAMGRTQEGVS